MSHYRVLIVIKNKDNQRPTDDDFYDILERNCTDEWYGEKIEPFGFDYLKKYTDIFKGKYIDKQVFSEIIIGDKEVWWCDGISRDKPEMSKEDALKMINDDDYCMLFDGHL